MRIFKWAGSYLFSLGWFFLGLLALSLASTTAVAQTPQTSWQVVEQGIAELTSAFEEYKDTYTSNPELLYSKLDEAMQASVDFRYISARVMGGRYFRAATPGQRRQFAETFQTTLVRTFGQGLMSFDYREFDLHIQEQETRFEDQDKVDLDVIAKNGKRYPVTFTLRLHDGQWKIINLIVNGINLGLTFNSQFDRAMREHNRNFDLVIANWSPDELLTEMKQSEVE